VLPAKGEFTKPKHHAALPYNDLPTFVARLSTQQGIPPRAMEFLILTAARTSEVLTARWSEFDLESRIWTIPPEKMKARKIHRVPLTDRMVEILKALPREGGADGIVFIGSKANTPLAKNTLSKLISTMGADCTVHGFRSSFRTWAAESTSYPREIVEAALAHTTGTTVELAYQRSDMLEKRRQLMQQWATFIPAPRRKAGTVTPIRKGGV